MTHKSKITPATSPLLCNYPTRTYLVKRTLLTYNINAFRICNILKFTQNSLVLTPYFVSIMGENLTWWNYCRWR